LLAGSHDPSTANNSGSLRTLHLKVDDIPPSKLVVISWGRFFSAHCLEQRVAQEISVVSG
jgi:hypothetical protein